MPHYTPRTRIDKQCPVCGAAFVASNPRYTYCSADCRRVATRAKSAQYNAAYKARHPNRPAENARRSRANNLEKARAATRNYMRRWREEHPEESRARTKHTYEARSEYYRAYQRRYRRENRERVQAQWAVNDAVKAGLMPHVKTLACVRCGAPATEYHHWSYAPDQWLVVEAMCAACHARADIERREKEKGQ